MAFVWSHGKLQGKAGFSLLRPLLYWFKEDCPVTHFCEFASYEDLVWIAKLEKRRYGSDAVPLETFSEWYNVNRYGFFVIRQAGVRIGHIDILPIYAPDFAPYGRGEIFETDLPIRPFSRRIERAKQLNSTLRVSSSRATLLSRGTRSKRSFGNC